MPDRSLHYLDQELLNPEELRLVEEGFQTAQYKFAASFAGSNKIPRNDEEVTDWLRIGAESGDTKAQILLGFAYRYGIGVSKNSNSAILWYRKAAEQGSPQAQFNMGKTLSYCDDVKDYKEAARWHKKAANQWFVPSQLALGIMYWYGRGVPRHYPRALAWLYLVQNWCSITDIDFSDIDGPVTFDFTYDRETKNLLNKAIYSLENNITGEQRNDAKRFAYNRIKAGRLDPL